MFALLKLRLLLIAMMSIAPLAAGMAQAPKAAPANPQLLAAARFYGQDMVRIIRSDQAVQQVLRDFHVTRRFAVALFVKSNGYVEKGAMVRSEEPPAIAQAVLNRLININFGIFPAGLPNRRFLFVVPVEPSIAGGWSAASAAPFQLQSIVLYQPNNVLAARACAAAPLAAYVKQIEANVAASLAALPPERGVTAAIVMGVKPGLQSRAWIVARPGTLPPAIIARITVAAQSAAPISVVGGPVAFAIIFNAWGGGQPITSPQNPPFPAEWLKAAGHGTVVPDGIFARIWP